MSRTPGFDWTAQPGPIGPGWLLMFAGQTQPEPERRSGFTILGAVRQDLLESREAAKKKRRSKNRPREAEALALLLLGMTDERLR